MLLYDGGKEEGGEEGVRGEGKVGRRKKKEEVGGRVDKKKGRNQEVSERVERERWKEKRWKRGNKEERGRMEETMMKECGRVGRLKGSEGGVKR